MIRPLLILATLLAATQWTVPLHVPAAGAGLSCPGSDSFSGTGNAALSSCWTSPANSLWSFGNTVATLKQNSGLVNPSGAFTVGAAVYTGGTTMTNGGVEITVTALTSPATFWLCGRGDNAGNGYCWDQALGTIKKFAGGASSTVVSACGGATVGDVYKLEITGSSTTTLTLTNVTTSNPLCSGNDTTGPYTSGFPVIIIDYSSGGSGTVLSSFAETP